MRNEKGVMSIELEFRIDKQWQIYKDFNEWMNIVYGNKVSFKKKYIYLNQD